MFTKKELQKLLYDVAELAYDKGREHQFEDDFPVGGMYLPKSFEDTKICKTIMDKP